MAYWGNEPAKVAVKVGSDAITTTQIEDGQVYTADLQDDAVTANKIDDDGTGFRMGSLGLGAAVSGSHKLTVGGTATFSGDITTDGIFKVDSAPDNDVIQFDQSGRKSAIKTHFASDSTGSKIILKVSDGNTNGGMVDALDIRPAQATFAGQVKISEGIIPNNGTANRLILKDANELNFYDTAGQADSDRSKLYIQHLGTGSELDLCENELLIVKGTGSTFAGNVSLKGDSGTLNFLNASGTQRAFLQLSSTGLIIDTDSFLEFKPNNTRALYIDSSLDSTFAGDVTLSANTSILHLGSRFRMKSDHDNATGWFGVGSTLNNFKFGDADFGSAIAEINLSANVTALQVIKDTGAYTGYFLNENGAGQGLHIKVKGNDSGQTGRYLIKAEGYGSTGAYSNNFLVDTDGNATFAGTVTSQNPKWHADGAPKPSNTSTVIYSNIVINTGGGYNSTTGYFTAPMTGYYYMAYWYNATGRCDNHIQYRQSSSHNWDNVAYAQNNTSWDASGWFTGGRSALVYMVANGQARIYAGSIDAGGTTGWDAGIWNGFSGFLVP